MCRQAAPAPARQTAHLVQEEVESVALIHNDEDNCGKEAAWGGGRGVTARRRRGQLGIVGQVKLPHAPHPFFLAWSLTAWVLI